MPHQIAPLGSVLLILTLFSWSLEGAWMPQEHAPTDSLEIVDVGQVPSIMGGYDRVSLVTRGGEVLDSLTYEVMPPTRVDELLVYYRYRQGYPDGVGGVFAAHPDGSIRRVETPLLDVFLTSPRVLGEWVYYWGFDPQSPPRSPRPYRISVVRTNVGSGAVDSTFVRRDTLSRNAYRYYHPVASGGRIRFFFESATGPRSRESPSVYVVEADSALDEVRVRACSPETR